MSTLFRDYEEVDQIKEIERIEICVWTVFQIQLKNNQTSLNSGHGGCNFAYIDTWKYIINNLI